MKRGVRRTQSMPVPRVSQSRDRWENPGVNKQVYVAKNSSQQSVGRQQSVFRNESCGSKNRQSGKDQNQSDYCDQSS